MKHGSLFSGIGGFDLAAEWMGWENEFHCEWNEFGQKVLKHYWPHATSYTDITKTDFSIHRGAIDILTGGFPCQPYSVAGKRKGKEDERHLWPEMLRAVREIKPTWVVGENVRGLVNWNGGLVFDEVQADLEAEGYEVQPFLLPACAVKAPHRRDRIWFVAHCQNNRREQQSWRGEDRNKWGILPEKFGERSKFIGSDTTSSNSNKLNGDLSGLYSGRISQQQTSGICENITDNDEYSNGKRCKELNVSEKSNKQIFDNWGYPTDWSNWPTQSPVCDGNDGISSELDGITFPKWRNESIKAGGNAIVPQVALQIFKAIEEYERTTNNK